MGLQVLLLQAIYLHRYWTGDVTYSLKLLELPPILLAVFMFYSRFPPIQVGRSV